MCEPEQTATVGIGLMCWSDPLTRISRRLWLGNRKSRSVQRLISLDEMLSGGPVGAFGQNRHAWAYFSFDRKVHVTGEAAVHQFPA